MLQIEVEFKNFSGTCLLVFREVQSSRGKECFEFHESWDLFRF